MLQNAPGAPAWPSSGIQEEGSVHTAPEDMSVLGSKCSAHKPGCCMTADAPDPEGRKEEVHHMPAGVALHYCGVCAGDGAVDGAVEGAVETGRLSGVPHMASAPGTVGTTGTSRLSLVLLDRRRMGPLGEPPGHAGVQGTGEWIAWLEVAEHVRWWRQ